MNTLRYGCSLRNRFAPRRNFSRARRLRVIDWRRVEQLHDPGPRLLAIWSPFTMLLRSRRFLLEISFPRSFSLSRRSLSRLSPSPRLTERRLDFSSSVVKFVDVSYKVPWAHEFDFSWIQVLTSACSAIVTSAFLFSCAIENERLNLAKTWVKNVVNRLWLELVI